MKHERSCGRRSSGHLAARRTGRLPILADYAQASLQRVELSGDLGEATLAQDQRHFDRLAMPDVCGIELGRVRVAKLTRLTVMAWDLAARTFSRTLAASHASGRNGAAAARRRGHPARAWARTSGVAVPKTSRLPVHVVKAWEEAGSPLTASPSGPAGNGDRHYEQARTALSSLCTPAVEDGYLLDHPVRIRPGTKARRKSRGEKRSVRIVTVEQLLDIASRLPDGPRWSQHSSGSPDLPAHCRQRRRAPRRRPCNRPCPSSLIHASTPCLHPIMRCAGSRNWRHRADFAIVPAAI